MKLIQKLGIVCLVLVLLITLICLITYIVKSNKENYPGIMDYKFTKSNYNILQERDIMKVVNRYGILPMVLLPEKFNRTTMFFMYALVYSFYVRLYSWMQNCNSNKRNWVIGQIERVYIPLVTNFYNTVFYYDLKDYLNAKRSGCTYPDTGADGDLQLANRNAQACNRFINYYGQVSEREVQNTLNFFDDVIAGRNRNYKSVWSVIIKRVNNLLNIYVDKEVAIETTDTEIRTNPYVYKLQNDYPPIALMPNRTVPSSFNFTYDVNNFVIGYTQTQMLGMCSSVLPVDWFQPIVREAGGVFRNTLSAGKLGVDYIIVFRGTVFPNEFKYATDFENVSFGKELYKVHKGFYDLYTNKPKFTRDKRNPEKDKMFKSYSFVNQQRTYFDEYEEKGSLQEQIRKLLKTEGSQIASLTICGHSLGAALTQIVLADIVVNKLIPVNKIKCCYLLNSPRTINVNLMRFLASSLKGQIYDIQNIDDFFPSFPNTHMEPRTESKKIVVDNQESTLVYVNKGYTFCHFDNLVGVQYNVDDLGNNHFAEAMYTGLNVLCNNISSPKTPITQDIQYNVIYQKLYDDGKVSFDNKLDKNRSLFLGTKNLSFWNRSLKTVVMPSLFREITPNRLFILTQRKSDLLKQSVKILIYNFIKNRLDNPSRNMQEISLFLENNIKISLENEVRQNETKKYNDLWVILSKFFNECLDLLSRNSLKIKGTNYGLSDYGIEPSKLPDLYNLSETVTTPNGSEVKVLKAITRTFYLIICPTTMENLSINENMLVQKALLSLFCYLNYTDWNSGYSFNMSKIISIEFLDNDIRTIKKVSTLFFMCINAYFARCGLYYDKIEKVDYENLKNIDFISLQKNFKTREIVGYDNVDLRTWEFLFGEVAPRYDTSIKFVLDGNSSELNIDINALANFDERSLPSNASEQTKYLYWGGVYKNLTITNNCEEEKSSCCDMTEIRYDNNSIINPSPYLKWGKPTGDQNNYPFIFPLPGYDSIRTSDSIKTNSGYLIDRYGQSVYNCFETYDVNMAENLILMFANKEWFAMNKEVTVFSNINKIGNIVYKDELNIVPNNIIIQPDNLVRYAADKDKITVDQHNLLIGTVNKITDITDKNVYMVFLDGENLDQKYLTGYKIFDALIYDLLLSIKSQQIGLIQDKVIEFYKKFKDNFWIGAAATLAASTLVGAGLGALIGTIFGGSSLIGAGALTGSIATGGLGAVIVGIISYAYIVAESTGSNNYEKARKLLIALPDLLTESLKGIAIDYVDTELDKNVNTGIGANYATGPIKQIIFKHLDELLGPQFTILDRKMIEASFASYRAVTSQNNPLDIERLDFVGIDEDLKNKILYIVTDKQNFFSYANLIYSSGSNTVRKQIVDILSNDIKSSNKPYHVFVAGHGMGGSLAHCLYLDLVLDNLRQNRLSSLNSNNFTFYSYGSFRVFNTAIYSALENFDNKPNFYNIVNIDDYLTSYPSCMLNGVLLTQKTITDMKDMYNIYLTNQRYYFSHFPNTFIFNRPMGYNTDINFVDNYNASNPNTQYVKKAHCAKTYYYGLRDFHRKVIGNWYCNKNYVGNWNYNPLTMPLGLPINPEVFCPPNYKKREIDVRGSKVPGCFADCKTENDCKDKFYTTENLDLVSAPFCSDNTCNPCPKGHNLIYKNGEYYCERNCSINRDPQNPNMECVREPQAYYGKIGNLENAKYCETTEGNLSGICKPSQNINCNTDNNCVLGSAYVTVNDKQYDAFYCNNNKCQVCPVGHNLTISADGKPICEKPCTSNVTCESIGALYGPPSDLKPAIFCDPKSNTCKRSYSCQTSDDCKNTQYLNSDNVILPEANFCNSGTCSVCPSGHEVIKVGNDYYCQKPCRNRDDCKETIIQNENDQTTVSTMYGKLNNLKDAPFCMKIYGENRKVCGPQVTTEMLFCENNENCRNVPTNITSLGEIFYGESNCQSGFCSICPPYTRQMRDPTENVGYCGSTCSNHSNCVNKTFNKIGEQPLNAIICDRITLSSVNSRNNVGVCNSNCPVGYELVQEGSLKFCQVSCTNNLDCDGKNMIDSDSLIKPAPICTEKSDGRKFCSSQ